MVNRQPNFTYKTIVKRRTTNSKVSRSKESININADKNEGNSSKDE